MEFRRLTDRLSSHQFSTLLHRAGGGGGGGGLWDPTWNVSTYASTGTTTSSGSANSTNSKGSSKSTGASYFDDYYSEEDDNDSNKASGESSPNLFHSLFTLSPLSMMGLTYDKPVFDPYDTQDHTFY